MNLRFYVRREVEGEVRRGVVFVREFVPRRAIAFVARKAYEENYAAARMRHALDLPAEAGGAGSVAYEWRHPKSWNRVAADFAGSPTEAEPGSQEEFITEHYWGYSAKRAGSVEYRVEHPRWRLWNARNPVLECDAATVYGKPFVEALSGEPSSAFIADGSEVIVRQGVALA